MNRDWAQIIDARGDPSCEDGRTATAGAGSTPSLKVEGGGVDLSKMEEFW